MPYFVDEPAGDAWSTDKEWAEGKEEPGRNRRGIGGCLLGVLFLVSLPLLVPFLANPAVAVGAFVFLGLAMLGMLFRFASTAAINRRANPQRKGVSGRIMLLCALGLLGVIGWFVLSMGALF